MIKKEKKIKVSPKSKYLSIPKRNFGVEIEFFSPSYEITQEITKYVTKKFNSSSVKKTGNYSSWHMTNDCSLKESQRDDHGGTVRWYGKELVSPILNGFRGIETVTKVIDYLKSMGAEVDWQCGLHVHVDAKDLGMAQISNVVKRYSKNQKIINSFFDSSREDNEYCQPFSKQYDVYADFRKQGWGDTLEDFYDFTDVNCERYQSVNLTALLEHGTIEFRQHHGTLDSKEVESWLIFLLKFVESSTLFEMKPKNKHASNILELAAAIDKNKKINKKRIRTVFSGFSTRFQNKWIEYLEKKFSSFGGNLIAPQVATDLFETTNSVAPLFESQPKEIVNYYKSKGKHNGSGVHQ